jgi:hypothetical protein
MGEVEETAKGSLNIITASGRLGPPLQNDPAYLPELRRVRLR